MNFFGHDHLSGFRRIDRLGAHRQTPWAEQESFHLKDAFLWNWHKGSRVSTINDWLQIQIGGPQDVKKKRPKGQNRIKSTKYTLITFLPQNLLEQFRRIANFYFLVMTIISLLIDSPVSPMTSLLPLVFVIAVTAAKQGYEDILRYRTDNVVNSSPVTVIRDGKEAIIKSQDVIPGELIVVERDCDVPCDLVLLRSTDPHGKCFITTANLDGESNLKTLMVPRDLPTVDLPEMHKLGMIECESPTTDLYSFNGKIELRGGEGRVLPLSAENVLLRGSRVKNTECVIGCAVYTGMISKLQLNSRLTRNKNASSETYINRFLIVILVALIAIVTLLYFLKRYNELFVIPKLFYLGDATDSYSVKQFLQDYLSFLILFNYLIPISLYVTIELQRVIGSWFMEWDLELYENETDQPCVVNTSNLNEELGQINILFSDKTGTLTKNEMNFQQCSINGSKFLFKKTRLEDEETKALLDINKFSANQRVFFQALSICHTVQVASGSLEQADAGTAKREPVTAIKSGPPEMYSISDITEESHNASQQSELNVGHTIDNSVSAHPNGLNSTTISSDVNPLLVSDDGYGVDRRKRPVVVKRSPNFARSNRMNNGAASDLNINQTDLNAATNGVEPTPNFRPISLQFRRSTSEKDLQQSWEAPSGQAPGHRRAHSYGAPNAYLTNPVSASTPPASVLFRSPSTTSRESYAAPTFTRQPTILVRAESQRRKNEIRDFIFTLDYQASSPDEKALVEACANLGMVYTGDDDETLRVRIVPPHMDYKRPFAKPREETFQRLHVLEFTSDRKRMSVIVRDTEGKKWIYTKGAESYVFPLCANSSAELVTKTDAHISDFARLGLRTLAIARRLISEEEYQDFLVELAQANSSLENRKQLSEECYAKIESNLDLLGATAVEDALQDDVADTLVSLQAAGIKIWVLTGDKVETALNIALSCGHIPPDAKKYFIMDCKNREEMLLHLNALDREIIFGIGQECALLIDGKSLGVALAEASSEFRDVAVKCTAVLCCRLSPLQKSEVVSLIKSSNENYNTASIGDGANDVSMIQEAHVGIGIMGREGRQAARCADFAFAKFCMLKRLLLVHGHYHSVRLSLLVLYFFYKNIVFMGIMFLFQFHTLFSSSSVYDSLFLTLYNVIYTSLPILFIAISEKPYTEEKLMRTPQLYKKNTDNKQLHWPYFLMWVLFAIYHSVIIFYFAFCLFYYNNVILNYGQTVAFSCFGTLLIWTVVVVVNLKLWLESMYLSFWYIFTIIISILGFIVTTVIYNVINLDYDTDIYWAYNNLLASLPVWLWIILTCVACLVPDYTIRMLQRALNIKSFSIFPGKQRKLKMREKFESTYL
ncbi:probable phospholipid-transporting ATPase IF isoform X1 [Drosophila sechellia]|uniref:probable phospholipid-transporting ATPase IF isoform X1 n=1 Tax=Drosophila sechellia TaxID=7238 RepID=UPI0013DDD697|nr:probable phospholipid-transporting ATPase IF isoform X1 [Drosophila sechellia]